MSEDYKIVRKHMIIHGDVQGVGFRYRARYAAEGLRLTGWVRNLRTGDVEMEVQGRESQIREMLVMINRGTYISISGIQTTSLPVDEEERGFHVR